MSTFILLFFFVFLCFSPVAFHLHYHRRGNEDYFVLELRLYKFFVWRYQIPGSSMDGIDLLNREKSVGSDAFLTNLIEVATALKKFGLGGTFLYFFLPEQYQKRVTVVERMENKGRFKRFVWRTVLAGLEPALLGPVVGLCWSIKGLIVGFLTNEYVFKNPPRMMVVPGFSEKSWETMLDCIFEIKLGHIIVAGIKDYLSELVGGKKHAGTPD